jgi:hypothetical protein
VSPSTKRSLFWLPGPLLAVLIWLSGQVSGGGPGAYFLYLVSSVLFLFVAPPAQFILLRTSFFKEKYGAACATVLLGISSVLFYGVINGAFSFW